MCFCIILRMNNILSTIAINIKKERQKQRLSQEELAEKANLHPNYIGLIERQQRNISILALEKIAKALNVSITEILK